MSLPFLADLGLELDSSGAVMRSLPLLAASVASPSSPSSNVRLERGEVCLLRNRSSPAVVMRC